MTKMPVRLTVNGQLYEVEVEPHRVLVDVLREELGLTGTKESCREGECGACTVIIDGKAVNSCLVLAVWADGKSIETVEGLATGGRLHPVQTAFAQNAAVQCGFCTPGFLMATKALLDEVPDPTEDEIRAALAGNICRCTGYRQIVAAVQSAARTLKEGGLGGGD